MIRALACIAVLYLAVGCVGDTVDGDSYFPLTPGLRWSYRVTTEVAGRRAEGHLEERNAGIQDLDGLPVAGHSLFQLAEGAQYDAEVVMRRR